jgi:ribonuclease E
MRAEAEDDDEPARGSSRSRPAAPAASSDGDEEEGRGEAEADERRRLSDEEAKRRRRRLMRRYKIQEVIRRRQIMLVQVVKEERGNKGAALTTYLSLAGRYCVLMPNTARGGGISRKITSDHRPQEAEDGGPEPRRAAGHGPDHPHGGRQAHQGRDQARLRISAAPWEDIRETTLNSIAPGADLRGGRPRQTRHPRHVRQGHRRSLWVEGEDGWREARDFMRMLMPSQAKKVQLYEEPTPLFVKHKVEDHLSQIHTPVVPLKSGGYLVINQTEALVADRRQLRQGDPRAQYRGHGPQDQHGGGRRGRPPAAPARSRRPHRHRLHRHG